MRALTHASLAVFVALSSLALVASGALAWTPISGSQPTWNETAPYSLNQNGSDDLGGYDATLTIVRDGMDDWTRVSCSSLHTSFEGSTSGVPFSSGSNTVGWIESGWIDSSSAIGITGPSWGGSGYITDAQMAMNGVHFTWTTDPGSGSRVNAYSITLHEAGHYYGLGHSSDGSATMYYAYSGGVSTLNSDDEAGICALYPGGGGGTTPDDGGTDPDPTPEPGGDGAFCDTCSSDADCASGGRCLRYPDDGLYCGQACSSDADCDGDYCESISDGSKQCVRRDSSGAPDCSATGDDPAPEPDPGPSPEPDPDDGGTGPGGDAGCTSDADCGATERCDVPSGSCIPRSRGQLGDDCTSNDDCASMICAVDVESDDSFCTQLCSDSDPCPTGFECTDAGGGSRACRPTNGAVGDECAGPGDCLTGLCAEGADGRFCTRECASATGCPSGWDCLGTEGGGASVCVEGLGGAPGADHMGVTGGCSAVRGSPAPPLGWLLVLIPALLYGRRRR